MCIRFIGIEAAAFLRAPMLLAGLFALTGRCALFSEVFYQAKLAQMDAAVERSVDLGNTPGGVLWLEREGLFYARAYGQRSRVPEELPMTLDTLFDAASLTKVLATTPAVMLLVERGQIRLDSALKTYLPEFEGDKREQVTVRHLLTHTSGLRPVLPARPDWSGRERALKLAFAEAPVDNPGTRYRYSDVNFILLGELVRRLSGKPLNLFVTEEFYRPLDMRDTGFLPAGRLKERIAPTEKRPDGVLHGVVHDPTSRRMGGVAGHAGLFIAARDLARFARMLLNDGELEGVRVLSKESVRLMTSVQTPRHLVRRGLGWDIDSPYASPRGRHFPIGSFGHTGWTGTSLWVDPFSKTFIIFLANRNHPTEAGNVVPLRRELGTLAAEAVVGFNFLHVPGALPNRRASKPEANSRTERAGDVRNGIDVLIQNSFAPLRGLQVGLITNHTGTDRNRRSTIDLLNEAADVDLKCLFSPEHGIRGVEDRKIGDTTDDRTGLPIYSLYGDTRQPLPEQLRGLDALIFDIQDIGCRFYTYISTMGLAMEAAAAAGLRFVVLDRVNPIDGVTIDGPVLQGEKNFVGFHPIPVRHGMTVGELARMFRDERPIELELIVIPVAGWDRHQKFDWTGLPWINPSPNMRSLTQAILYPAVGLLETTALSVGRGTDTPFEVVGAPYIDDVELARRLNAAAIKGVRFIPIRFTPDASVFRNQTCGGVNIILTDRDQETVVDIGLHIARTLHGMYPGEYDLAPFLRLLRHPPTLEALHGSAALKTIRRSWHRDLHEFRFRREKYLLYPKSDRAD